MYLHGITNEQYKEAAALADALIERLRPRVLGRESPAISCDCGAVHHAAGVVVGIMRSPYREQVLGPFRVAVVPHGTTDGSTERVYGLPLDMFLPREELRAIWKDTFMPFLIRHFPSVQETLRSGTNDHLWGF